jgi:hypothetical protein
MLDVLEVQDQLKNFSQEQLLREMQMPTGNVPQFLVLSELNRRRTMSQDLAKRQSADQPTVKEEVVASSGMPMEKASMMAQQMAPKTSMTENTGIASMMPRELPSEEEPMKMSYGGMLMGSRMTTGMFDLMNQQDNIARPAVSNQRVDMNMNRGPESIFRFGAMQRRFPSGLSNLGRDISGRVQNRTQEEVDDFIGEVNDMAQERFEVNLSEPSQRQRNMQSFLSGKGQPDPRTIRTTSAIPFAMKDGGPIKAQSGLFAQGTPSFATIYNYAKTQLGLDDELARDVARKTLEESDSMGYRTGALSSFPIGVGIGPETRDEEFKDELERITGEKVYNEPLKKETDYDQSIYQETDDELDALKYERLGGTVDSDSFNELAFGYKPKTRVGKYVGYPLAATASTLSNVPTAIMGGLEKATGATRDFLFEPLVDGKSFDEEATLAQYVGQPSKDVDAFNKMISDQLKAKDNLKAPDARDFRKRQEQMIYEESMKRANESSKQDEEKRKIEEEKKKEEDRILGGFGKASGALSDLSAQIADLKEKREKGRESEKWFALAEVGLGMLASQSPTLAGALGEGGLRGLKSFRQGKKDYDKDMLGYLSTQASIAKSQAELGVKGLVAQKQIEALKSKTSGGMTQKERTAAILNINKELNDLYELGKYDVEDPKIKRAIFDLETQKRRLQLNLPVGPTVIDKDLTATTAIG